MDLCLPRNCSRGVHVFHSVFQRLPGKRAYFSILVEIRIELSSTLLGVMTDMHILHASVHTSESHKRKP